MFMEFDLDCPELSWKQKELERLWTEYNEKYKEFDTWKMSQEELYNILKECIEKNKSYEEIYGKNRISKYIDY